MSNIEQNLQKILASRYGKDVREAIYESILQCYNLITGDSPISPSGNGDYFGKTVVMFGDSIVAGWGWQEGTGITKPLSEKYPKGVWINQAVSGSNMANTSSASTPSIVSKVKSYTGAADGILLEGGTNDNNNSIPIGTITSGYDDSFNEETFTGALESCLHYIMNKYPLAYKMFLIPHAFIKDNSYVDPYHDRAVEVCSKWNMPVLDMRNFLQLAMTSSNKSEYTRNPNTNQGDGVHPTEIVYRTFYSPLVDKFFQNLGILSSSDSEEPPEPEVIPVTGVSLNKKTLELTSEHRSETLVATITPSNASNKTLIWESSDPDTVSVSNGTVTAKKTGSVTITVRSVDGNHTDTCSVTANILPSEGHIELDWIRVSMTAWFDTGYTPNANTKTEIKLGIDTLRTEGCYFCGARDNTNKFTLSGTDTFYATRGKLTSAAKPFGVSTSVVGDFVFKQEGNMAYANEFSVTLDSVDSLNFTTHYVIGNSSSPDGVMEGLGLIGKIYYAKIWDNDDLVVDLIPVRRYEDEAACLYDKVSKSYILNSGTGAVTGPT